MELCLIEPKNRTLHKMLGIDARHNLPLFLWNLLSEKECKRTVKKDMKEFPKEP